MVFHLRQYNTIHIHLHIANRNPQDPSPLAYYSTWHRLFSTTNSTSIAHSRPASTGPTWTTTLRQLEHLFSRLLQARAPPSHPIPIPYQPSTTTPSGDSSYSCESSSCPMPNILGYRLSHLTSAPITLGQKIGLHPVRRERQIALESRLRSSMDQKSKQPPPQPPLTLTTFSATWLHALDPSISFVVQVTVINYEISLEMRKGTSSHLRTTWSTSILSLPSTKLTTSFTSACRHSHFHKHTTPRSLPRSSRSTPRPRDGSHPKGCRTPPALRDKTGRHQHRLHRSKTPVLHLRSSERSWALTALRPNQSPRRCLGSYPSYSVFVQDQQEPASGELVCHH